MKPLNSGSIHISRLAFFTRAGLRRKPAAEAGRAKKYAVR